MLQHKLVIITDSKSRFKDTYQNNQTIHFFNLSRIFGQVGILKENSFVTRNSRMNQELKKVTREKFFLKLKTDILNR